MKLIAQICFWIIFGLAIIFDLMMGSATVGLRGKDNYLHPNGGESSYT